MSDKTKESLSVFMKKQISEKSSKKTSPKISSLATTQNLTSEEKGSSIENEMNEEEKLEEAKKNSTNKASQHDQSKMLRRLFLESLAKYLLIAVILIIFTIGIVESGPLLFKFFHELLFKAFLGRS